VTPLSFELYLENFKSIYKNWRTDVCLSVGMWRASGNPNPCTDLDEILHTHPHLSKEGIGPGFTPSPMGLGGLKPYKLKDTLLRCSAGCK